MIAQPIDWAMHQPSSMWQNASYRGITHWAHEQLQFYIVQNSYELKFVLVCGFMSLRLISCAERVRCFQKDEAPSRGSPREKLPYKLLGEPSPYLYLPETINHRVSCCRTPNTCLLCLIGSCYLLHSLSVCLVTIRRSALSTKSREELFRSEWLSSVRSWQ